jgi:hypothetical protein
VEITEEQRLLRFLVYPYVFSQKKECGNELAKRGNVFPSHQKTLINLNKFLSKKIN